MNHSKVYMDIKFINWIIEDNRMSSVYYIMYLDIDPGFWSIVVKNMWFLSGSYPSERNIFQIKVPIKFLGTWMYVTYRN